MDARVVPLAMLYRLNTDLLLNCLEGLSDREAQTRLEAGGNSRLGMIAFLVQHDSYRLGQIAFLRRQLGKPPMSYARNVGLTPAGGRVR